MDLKKLERDFRSHDYESEDDVKVYFYSDIIKPIIAEIYDESPAPQYYSEKRTLSGGRADASFRNISFEFKKFDLFKTTKGREEALWGRNERDHGLFDYILDSSGVTADDAPEAASAKICSAIGIGFDGRRFLIARFIPSAKNAEETAKKLPETFRNLPLAFHYEVKEFQQGLRYLALLLKQREKIALNKANLLSVINVRSEFVRRNIPKIYHELYFNLNDVKGSNRVQTLYDEWNRVFGIMYGSDNQATDFTTVTPQIREAYGLDEAEPVDSKMYLFALQTFFNIFLKLLVYSFLSQMLDPAFSGRRALTKSEIDLLFDGEDETSAMINNFFEAHFLEWFTYTSGDTGEFGELEEHVVNETLEVIDQFDLGTYVLKPEEVQDILQELYMELIPAAMRHLMGEYFSPDWIVAHVLDMAGYDGDIDKTLIDPCAGSGTFLTQAIKRVIQKQNGVLTKDSIEKIMHNIVGFDINPISVVAAKANYILTVFSAYFSSSSGDFGAPVSIPVFIADSILAPVVYTEESGKVLSLKTSVGELELPKFDTFSQGNLFLRALSSHIHEKANLKAFLGYVKAKNLMPASGEETVRQLFERLYTLHRAGKDSFWPNILRNSFAPTMIGEKFDFVVGNPPWIAWKSMSHSYREGSLSIWASYGIFEKNAYDKKTTHDDFGMAVTYVAVDQYLKNGGTMVFLLPVSFLKSTKGGEGFRKFEIVRNWQNVPFSVVQVDDFSNVRLFTVPTMAVKFLKGQEMRYPMKRYHVYTQRGGKTKIDNHSSWDSVSALLSCETLEARPVDVRDPQSAWLTLKDTSFASRVLDSSQKRYYQGRKGIEPAGAKGVYILKKPKAERPGYVRIENDLSRQRRQDIIDKGIHAGVVEETYVYPMLGGRNIAKWKIKSHEFMLVPHTSEHKYGIPEDTLALEAPDTWAWLCYFRDELLLTRKQNGKFFNEKTNPFYRLDNVGEYTFSPYKVLWKEQAGHMSAVVAGTYGSIPDAETQLLGSDKPVVVDSKVLMLGLENEDEAYFVCGILNAPNVAAVIDGYAISTNRGIDVLKYIAVPKYDAENDLHTSIVKISRTIHAAARQNQKYDALEDELAQLVFKLFV